MKKLIYAIIIIFSFSCADFLKESSQDLIIPKTVKDYSEFLFGEGYIRNNVTLHTYLDIMTDDVEEKANTTPIMQADIRGDGYGYFCWQANPEYRFSGALNADNAWETYYNKILITNNVINLLDEAQGTRNDKDDLLAEAYFLRAYYYFMLVNLYGEPYRKETADKALGIPFNFKHSVREQTYKRESLARSYELIETDLKKSIELFEKTDYTKNVFRISKGAAYLLASRFYLYKKEYGQVVSYADKTLTVNSNLYDIRTLGEDDYVFTKANPEIIWTYGNYNVNYLSSAYRGCFPVASGFYNSFHAADARKRTYIKDDWGDLIVGKGAENTGMYGFAFRTAEAYLNRAEANAELGNIQEAMNDIKHLQKYRFDTEVSVSVSTKADAIRLVREERRFELCFEQHRWFDLRRWDCPRIEHIFTTDLTSSQKMKFVLEENDKAYTLPLPVEVKEFDYNLENINRPERKGIIVQ